MKPPILFDRSRIVARCECPRLRFLNYHMGGTGIERVKLALPLVNGIHVHAAIADVLMWYPQISLDHIVTKHLTAYQAEVTERGIQTDDDPELLVKEQSALIEGLIRGWVKLRLPRLLEEYEVVSVEEEMQWEMAPGLIQMLRLDGLLRHKVTKLLFILELKTVGMPGYQWQQGWEKNIQFMSYTQAVREITGEECGGVIVEGLVKGTRRRETAASSPFCGANLQNSPFCYAYAMKFKGSTEVMLSTAWSRGAEKVLVTNHVPMKAWVEELHSEGELEKQFVSVPPISPLPEQILRWRRQTIAAETRFAMALSDVQYTEDVLRIQTAAGCEPEVIEKARAILEEKLDFHFPQHDTHCNRYFGSCSFADVCFEPNIGEDPLGSGLYKKRDPHHTSEIEQ